MRFFMKRVDETHLKHSSNNGLITSGGLADLLQTILALDLRDNTFPCAKVSFCFRLFILYMLHHNNAYSSLWNSYILAYRNFIYMP